MVLFDQSTPTNVPVIDGGLLSDIDSRFDRLGQLAWVVRNRIAPGRVARAVDALFRTDEAVKSSAGDPRVLLERLVVELCGVGGPGRST